MNWQRQLLSRGAVIAALLAQVACKVVCWGATGCCAPLLDVTLARR